MTNKKIALPFDNVSDLIVFTRVADLLSFTYAAENLEMSRSAVGKSIVRLEERLNLRLFHRTTRNISLTAEGELFYQHAQFILNEIEEAKTALDKLNENPRGRLRIDLPIAFGRRYILPLLQTYLTQWPELKAEITFSDEYTDLVKNGIDLAIRIGGNDDSRLMRKVLAPHRLITCASLDYFEQYGIPQSPNELSQHQLIIFSHQGTTVPWKYQVHQKECTIPVKGKLHLDNTEAILDMALSSYGVCQLGEFLVGESIKSGKLVPILLENTLELAPICAIYPSKRHLSPKIRYFLDFIEKQWKGKATWQIT
ncbi:MULTISPECIES: LysR family transcriptional regulator [Gammaproteobacteria]|uniref:LysR family transcriptional regulator n=1 Tax=Gammaproteobacteria TaxID=1236 RepID=UPI00299F8E2E|nr:MULTISPECIES: LysR family transcriptional regulator [Gammaproteobacteria]